MSFIEVTNLYTLLNAMQVKLNLSLLEDISDDIEFCFKLAKEESVIILPGTVGLVDYAFRQK